MSVIRLPDDWLWVRAYSPYDIARYLLVQTVRNTDTRVVSADSLSHVWRRAAHSIGLDKTEDRVYHRVWLDVIHSLLSEYNDVVRARLVTRYMIEAVPREERVTQ